MESEPIFRPLMREELDLILDWAAKEGWNPGLQDAEAFWSADPQAFVGIELDGELVGAGAIVSYAGKSGFMGLFIVRPEWRGRGLGRRFWIYRRDLLLSRLDAEASISMDGVFAMQSFYAKGGFVFTHRNLRMEGVGKKTVDSGKTVELKSLPFEQIEAYDFRHFLAPRTTFLKKWIYPEGGRALGLLEGENLVGYGVIRPCVRGFKIGPLFADHPDGAEELFSSLSRHAEGAPLFLDVPENNSKALALADRHGLKEVFGCARMVYGPRPALPWGSIYGVTTFELG